MKYTALISQSADNYARILEEDFDVLRLPCDMRLDTPVASHADMNVFILGNTAVLSRLYAETNPQIVNHLRDVCGFDVILSDGERKREYPFDVMLNVLVCANTAFSFEKYTCDEIKKLLFKEGIDHVNVRQGYSACSTLAFGNSIITADNTILRAARKAGADCLEITPGGITLPGYSEGFIGGASGVCGNKIYFTGNVRSHPDGEKILRFIEKGGFEAVSLSEGELIDVGGIKFVKNLTPQR